MLALLVAAGVLVGCSQTARPDTAAITATAPATAPTTAAPRPDTAMGTLCRIRHEVAQTVTTTIRSADLQDNSMLVGPGRQDLDERLAMIPEALLTRLAVPADVAPYATKLGADIRRLTDALDTHYPLIGRRLAAWFDFDNYPAAAAFAAAARLDPGCTRLT